MLTPSFDAAARAGIEPPATETISRTMEDLVRIFRVIMPNVTDRNKAGSIQNLGSLFQAAGTVYTEPERQLEWGVAGAPRPCVSAGASPCDGTKTSGAGRPSHYFFTAFTVRSAGSMTNFIPSGASGTESMAE